MFNLKEISSDLEITVYDTQELYGEKGNFRVLQFSEDAIQGAMDLDQPERIMFEYPRAMIHLMEFNDPHCEQVFLIGHGIGTLASYWGEKHCKVAEINEQVVHFSKKYFGYHFDNITIGDGRQILQDEPPSSYEYIIVDAFSKQGTPSHLTSLQFYRLCRDKLTPQGAIVLNLMGKGENDRLIQAIYTTLSEVFPYTKVFYLPTEGITFWQNIVIMGSNKPIGYRARSMAGFVEIELGLSYVIMDSSE